MAHPDTIAAREGKAAHAAALGITEERVSDLVEIFYARIRGDDLLGPIFDNIISDWPMHLGRMKAFWTSIAIESGRFHGSPMVKHLAISGIDRAHFDHWLVLFNEILPEAMPNSAACTFFSDRAARIADSLMTGIALHRDGLPVIPQKTKTAKQETDNAAR